MKNIILGTMIATGVYFLFTLFINPEITDREYSNLYGCVERNSELQKEVDRAFNSSEKIDSYEYEGIMNNCRKLDRR